MKKIIVLFLGLATQIFFGQATRFVYQITMKMDSTNRAEIKSENAYLDINAEKSIFYGEKRLLRDSVFSRARQTQSFNFDRSQMQNLRSDLDFVIEKNSKKGTTNFQARIGRDQYSYDEDRPMEWKILPETANIGEYKTQKAQTNFAGRTWNAWFTTEIPLQDGPYKFSGLPGLIVKVEDEKEDYSCDLKETKKIKEIGSFEQRGTTIALKRAVFEKQQDQFRKDPISTMFSSGRGNFRMQMDPNQRKQMEDRIKEEVLKNNNPIELK